MDFNYYLPINLKFGINKIDILGEEVKKYGKKALIVTGRSSTKKSGLLDKAISLLKKEGLSYELFDKVEKNPVFSCVYQGAKMCKDKNCDVIVGLGGGSVMDASKAIAFCVKNEGDIADYIFAKKDGSEALPIILVPTTCGTGSEGNGFAVLTNDETKDKKSLRTDVIVPSVSIVDPNLMKTMPKHILASVGFDAFCHNMEAYISKAAQPFTDIYSYYGMKLLTKNLIKVYEEYDNSDAWESVSLASTIGGMVINTAGVCASHGLEHPLSGLKDIVHGQGLAALTPVITDKTYSYSVDKYNDIALLLGGKKAEECSSLISDMLDKLNLNIDKKQFGISENDIDWLCENAIKVSLPSIKNNPKEFSLEEIKEIYKMFI